MRRNLLTTRSLNFSLYTVLTGIPLFPWGPLPLLLVAGIDEEEEEAGIDEERKRLACMMKRKRCAAGPEVPPHPFAHSQHRGQEVRLQ